jgi:large subunit ribosomal protein L28
MLKRCAICGKGEMQGRAVSRKGLAKSKGGTGKKTTRTTRRSFLPNLHKTRAFLNNKPQIIYACTKCIKAGKLQRA